MRLAAARADSAAPQLVYADVAGHYNRPELFAHLFPTIAQPPESGAS